MLDSKVAMLIGGSSGIGRAVARRFGEEGADVVIGGLHEKPPNGGPPTHELIRNKGNRAMFVECDVTDQTAVDNAINKTTSEFGRIDIGFNCAGTVARGPLTEAEEEDIRKVVEVNLCGAMRFGKAVLPELIETDGTLINISSEAAEKGIKDLPAYCASKGGVNALTRQLAIQFGPKGVNINAISPGTTKTPINERVRQENPSWIEERTENIPIGRLNEPEDIGALAAFLASNEANKINGAIVNIDGGSTAL